MTSVSDPERGELESLAVSGHGVAFRNLGVAVVNAPAEQMRASNPSTAEDSAVLAIEPERYLYPISSDDYLRGYRDAVDHLINQMLSRGQQPPPATAAEEFDLADLPTQFQDDADGSWGLHATQTIPSHLSGQGVAIAILDSGLDRNHPDFLTKKITAFSFVAEEIDVQDAIGHGTHTAGTAAGPEQPGGRARYGIAYAAELFIGKVISQEQKKATDTAVLQGIQWQCGTNAPSCQCRWAPR